MKLDILIKIFKSFLFISLLLLVSCVKNPVPGQDPAQYQFRETIDLINFVHEAAELISEKGEAAFSEFGKEDSKWYSQSRYIFVYNLSGDCVFHPVLKEVVGKNLLNLTDINGKPIGKLIQSIASNSERPFGWIHYLWTEPGEIFPSWKDAYVMGVKAPDGIVYAIGSGTYNIRTETKFVTDIVDSAYNLIQKTGKDAYPQFLDKASVFYFNNVYVFVLGLNGQLLVNPSYPTNIGRNVMEFKDYSGHLIINEMLERLKKEDVVYISYMWPAPGQPNPSKKMMYARKVLSGNDTVIVGSSLYLMEAIWKKF